MHNEKLKSEDKALKRYTKAEQWALKKLDIPDFRHMTKDKMIKFLSIQNRLNRMDPEVAKAAIAQFPNFSEIAKGCLIDYKEIVVKLIEQDSKENNHVFEFYNSERLQLEKTLENDELTFEQKQWCFNELHQLANEVSQYESECKTHRLKIIASYATAAVMVLATAASAIGGTLQISNSSKDEDEIE